MGTLPSVPGALTYSHRPREYIYNATLKVFWKRWGTSSATQHLGGNSQAKTTVSGIIKMKKIHGFHTPHHQHSSAGHTVGFISWFTCIVVGCIQDQLSCTLRAAQVYKQRAGQHVGHQDFWEDEHCAMREKGVKHNRY